MNLGIDRNVPNYDQLPIDSGSEELVSDPEVVAQQWVAVLKDGIISASEFDKYPALRNYIVNTLGYGSIEAFLEAHKATGQSVGSGGVKLSDESLAAISKSIFGSLNGAGAYFAEGPNNQLPQDIDPESTFVVFTLQNGEKITFDGPNAGKIANEFAKIYNNSPTFRNIIIDLANKQGGQYSFHSVPLEATPKSQTVGFNFAGTSPGVEASGVFIQANPSFSFNIAATIIHEVTHDLNSTNGLREGSLPSAGGSHSRRQSIIHSEIVNELKENGIDINYDVDGDDYSQDTLIFDKDFDSDVDQDSGEVTSNSVVYDENGKSVNALDYYTKLYAEAKTYIAQGNYAKAAEILARIPPNATITLTVTDAQTGEKSEATYNVRQLMIQDLMFAADGADRFDSSGNTHLAKKNLENFFLFLTQNDSSGQWKTTIAASASAIQYGLAGELPGYVYAGLDGVNGGVATGELYRQWQSGLFKA